MKVTISGYVGKKKTGIGRTLENILRHMPLETHDSLELFCNKDFHEFDARQFPRQTNLRPFKVSKNASLKNLLWHQFVYPFKTVSADASYIPNVTLLLWKRRPTVAVIHDMIEFNIPEKFSWYRMLYRKFAVPMTARRADTIITVSQASKEDIVKFCRVSPDKIHVIYNGVSDTFQPAPPPQILQVRERYDLPERYILYVGTIDHPGKNVYSLIQACRKLWKENNEPFSLVLAGQPGHGFEHVEPLIRSEKRIKHLGYVTDEHLPALYSGASLFGFLSLYEGFGLPIIEAMACGVPVLASNCPPFPEIVEQAGLIVEPHDIDAISRNIQTVLSDPQLKNQLTQKGLERARAFSWKEAAEKTYQVLKQTASGRSL